MVDARGRILVARCGRRRFPTSVRRALADIEPGEPDGPAIDADWGEPGLTPAERVFGWNSARGARVPHRQSRPSGQRDSAARDRAPAAALRRRLRSGAFMPALRAHLDAHGFAQRRRCGRRRIGADARDAPRSRASVGALGRARRSRRTTGARPRSCRTSAGRCPTTASPTCSACRRSGCRTRIRRARSMRRTSTCWRRSRARASRS